MVKPIDQETTVIEKMVCCTHSSQKKGVHHATGERGHTRVSQELERKRKTVTRDFIVVSTERTGMTG